jgi:hypothetical protein
MATDRVIYTDGRDVTVTDSALKVRNTSYKLSGITKLSFWTIRPDRAPAIILMVLGLAAAVAGFMGAIPSQVAEGNPNALALLVGIGLFIVGLLILVLARERYAVRIATAEGEKNAVVSRKREYIAQIVDAVYSAFDFGTGQSPIQTTQNPGP